MFFVFFFFPLLSLLQFRLFKPGGLLWSSPLMCSLKASRRHHVVIKLRDTAAACIIITFTSWHKNAQLAACVLLKLLGSSPICAQFDTQRPRCWFFGPDCVFMFAGMKSSLARPFSVGWMSLCRSRSSAADGGAAVGLQPSAELFFFSAAALCLLLTLLPASWERCVDIRVHRRRSSIDGRICELTRPLKLSILNEGALFLQPRVACLKKATITY